MEQMGAEAEFCKEAPAWTLWEFYQMKQEQEL